MSYNEKVDPAILPAVAHRDVPVSSPGLDEKMDNKLHGGHDEIVPADDDIATIVNQMQHGSEITPEMRNKVRAYYGHKAEEDGIAPSQDVEVILDRIIEMSEDEALDILVQAVEYHREDTNFPQDTMEKIQRLLQGYKSNDMEASDWSFELRAEAAIIHYHSPYPEVRAVTSPFDDPTTPCETWRAYFLGMCFMAGATALNTFFSPRQPGISISSNVLQLLLAPCGQFLARFVPKWSVSVRGHSIPLNPGPWTYKEQMLSTLMFTVASGAGGTYYVYLVQSWVTFGYEILLALAVQTFGFGFAGILRRFVIFPVNAIWPSILPTLALNRALILPEKKGENINGWKLSRYQFFMACFAIMFVYFWITNTLFTALRLFNWMTWIAPNNFALANITGSYGGMGFNPISSFDWNVFNNGALNTPFWSYTQQYAARVLSGLIIIGMYWNNAYWGAYMPINSNESFDNTGNIYNVSKIMGDDGYVSLEKYNTYGPPYFSGANVFGQGAWFAWYPCVLIYVFIRSWTPIRRGLIDMGKAFKIRNRGNLYDGHYDAHTRMIRAYKEVPEYYFMLVMVAAFSFGVAALEAWPTRTPWWALLLVVVINFIYLIPTAIMYAASNVQMGVGLFFQMLSGCIFRGNPEANIIMNAFAGSFNAQADNYISDLKMAHYSKLPPRAVFRAQMIAVYLNCFIFVAMLNWMVTSFSGGGTLCTWDNPQHFVCTDAVLTYATAIEYGAFGIPNLFKLYPIFPFCFLIGALSGIAIGLGQKYGPSLRARAQARWSEVSFERWNRWFFYPLSYLQWFHPGVFWGGALNWTGGNNLSYATGGLYCSIAFMWYIKKRYLRWWQKYNYLIVAGFGCGVAISGIIQSLVFSFSNGGKGITISWWGNNVATQGIDYQSYNQNASLLKIPEQGYFGPGYDDWPRNFGGLRS